MPFPELLRVMPLTVAAEPFLVIDSRDLQNFEALPRVRASCAPRASAEVTGSQFPKDNAQESL